MLTSLDDKIGHLNDRKYVFTHRNDTAEQASRRYGSKEVDSPD